MSGENDPTSDDIPPQPPVTDPQRELAAQAMSEFEKGQFTNCTKTMGQLADARPTDVKVVHNRSVALFYQSQCRAVDEFRHNIQTVFNMAVVLYHEKQYRAALSVLEKLFRYIEPIDETLAQKMMLLLTELYLTVHQPYDAMRMIVNIEKFLSGKSQSSQDKDKDRNDSIYAAAQEALKAKLTLYKVRCNLMAKVMKNKKECKALQGNSQPVNYVKAYYEYLKGNLKKAAKMLGNPPAFHISPTSGECLAVMYANNQALINMCLNKPNLAVCQLRDALRFNEKAVREAVPNDKARPPLQVSFISQHYVLFYNLGVLQLHCKRPSAAFDCLVECVQVFHRNPRLWLRLAECCIMHYREVRLFNNDVDREHKLKLDVIQASVGSGFHHKLILGQGVQRNKKVASSGGVFPTLSLGFASFCLKNALALLPVDPLDVRPPPQDEQAESGPPPTDPLLISTEPGNPLRETEVANLRCSILAASAYVALCENEYYKALAHAANLLRQPNLSPAQRYLGYMYKGEALIALDRIADAVDTLNPDNVTDVSTTLPESVTDQEKDQEKLAENRESLVKWQPSNVTVARAFMQYNLAVMTSSEKVGTPIPVHMFYLKLYLDLKQGNKQGAISIINEHFGYISRN
ncbi:unnamed protein product [Candidula unifasciata]|uniref:CCR4-NOT transcription complex subunit 10 n=1 Tax=Candidula unifasciata TaxID=100452 RepID=A0A8S3ZHJ3_9EUPU|nr:unnamed protein product [Candidula unifasciata]